jgi:hypothetical protein
MTEGNKQKRVSCVVHIDIMPRLEDLFRNKDHANMMWWHKQESVR